MISTHACRGRSHGLASRIGSACIAATCAILPAAAPAQVVPYNPYADSQDPTPALLPDGTIHWGTFYKSAAIQKAYERLWNLGACRNTNKAITIPVENNKLKIDSLPEAQFRGVVTAVAGTNSGGAIAFTEPALDGSGAVERVALLHPAGVSRVDVSGTAAAGFLVPGMTVRFQTRVDSRGRSDEPLRLIHVLTPSGDVKPVPVTTGREELVVGKVVSLKRNVLSVRVDAGKIRRLSLTLAEDLVVEVQSQDVSLVRPGDLVELEGRLWTGEGSLGEGSVFANRVTVVKHGPQPDARANEAADDGVGVR